MQNGTGSETKVSSVKRVEGFLSSNGTFFEKEAECQRYEYEMALRVLCESHEVNTHNLFVMLREWKIYIRGYYDADDRCEQKRTEATGSLSFEGPTTEPLPQVEGDSDDAARREEGAESVLEFEARRRV